MHGRIPSPLIAAALLFAASCAATLSPHAVSLRNCAEQEDSAEGRNRCYKNIGNEPGESGTCAEAKTTTETTTYETIGADQHIELLKEAQYLRHEDWEAIANAPLVYDVDWGSALVGDESRNATEWIRGALLGRDASLTVGVSPTTRKLLDMSIDQKGVLIEDFVNEAPSSFQKEATEGLAALEKELGEQVEHLHALFTGMYMALDKARATTSCYRQFAEAELRMVSATTKLLETIRKSREVVEARYKSKQSEESAAAKEELAAWQASKSEQCRQPKKATDCDDLEAFLAKYPAGAHAEEAKAIVAAVEGTIRPLRDEAAWKASAPSCRAPKASSDCDGVKDYVENFRNGNHMDEAEKLLRLRRAALAQLAAHEDAQRRVAAMRARQECSNQCVKALRGCQKDCSGGAPADMAACQKSCLSTFNQSCVPSCKK